MDKRRKIFSNLIWRFMERIGAQGVTLIVSIVLARLLDPEIYGTVALVTVFTNILQVFIDSGLGNALIQKKDADDLDFSSVFYFNVMLCIVLYLFMFMAAPMIASFYSRPELVSIVRVISIIIIISGVKNIQQAYVSKTMQFKKFFFSTLGGTIGAAVIGIILAYCGFGVWALVAQMLFNAVTDTIILWFAVKWRPKKIFSFKRLRDLFDYGWKLLISGLLDSVYNNIRQLIIGRMYSSSDLAFFNKGKQFPNLIVTNVNTSIDSVLLPSMSAEQSEPEKVKVMTCRAIKISTYIMAPMMMGLAFIGEPFVRLLLTEKWIPCVPYLRIFCITFMFYPIHTSNLNAIKAMGRSDLFLKLEIVKKIIGFIALLATMNLGVMMMAYSLLLTSVLSQIINSWPNKKLLKYGYMDQLKDIIPNILMALIMGICIYPLKYLPLHTVIILIIQVILGVGIYFVESCVLKNDSYTYLKSTIKIYINKKA